MDCALIVGRVLVWHPWGSMTRSLTCSLYENTTLMRFFLLTKGLETVVVLIVAGTKEVTIAGTCTAVFLMIFGFI